MNQKFVCPGEGGANDSKKFGVEGGAGGTEGQVHAGVQKTTGS